MNNLVEYIQKARPESKESSIKAYMGMINKFIKHPNFVDNPADETWIEDTEWIDHFLGEKNLKDSTLRNHYVALMVYCEGLNGGKYSDKWQDLDEYLHFKNMVDKLNNKLKLQPSITENQSKNIPEKKEIEDLLKKLTPEIRKIRSGMSWHSGLASIENGLEKTKTFMAYVLISIYMSMEVRNEIASLILMGRREYNKLDEKNNNYIIVEKSKTTIYRHKYKTKDSKTAGGVKENILSKELRALINAWIKWRDIKKGEKLFPDLQVKKDEATASTAELNLTKFLQRFFDKHLQKKVSTTLLAKMNIQDKISKDTLETINKISDTRGTSVSTITSTYA
tara:strand:- start:1307 stop:2317 length:1011 start_codon:yes stop_codon:yes gene_type:complete